MPLTRQLLELVFEPFDFVPSIAYTPVVLLYLLVNHDLWVLLLLLLQVVVRVLDALAEVDPSGDGLPSASL